MLVANPIAKIYPLQLHLHPFLFEAVIDKQMTLDEPSLCLDSSPGEGYQAVGAEDLPGQMPLSSLQNKQPSGETFWSKTSRVI